VHNTFAVRLFEVAEAEMLRRLGLTALIPAMPRVRTLFEFRRRLFFGDRVQARVEVAAVGRTSVTYAMRADSGGATAITGEVVAVHAPGESSAPWPEAARAALAGGGDLGPHPDPPPGEMTRGPGPS
jgi:acyl-CoA thioester hydrolase